MNNQKKKNKKKKNNVNKSLLSTTNHFKRVIYIYLNVYSLNISVDIYTFLLKERFKKIYKSSNNMN